MNRASMRLALLMLIALVLSACALAPGTPDERKMPRSVLERLMPTRGQSATACYPSFAPLMRRITPAVVNVSAETELSLDDHPFLGDPEFRAFLERFGFPLPKHGATEREQSIGSGVIIDAARGYVMTNAHLLQGATTIEVVLKDQRRFRAELLGMDEHSDIAILRIPPLEIAALHFADSDRLEVGDLVIAIGNPFGLGQSVTLGIVSAIGRDEIAGNRLGALIQTDASINPGNSGGPLINLGGEIVGINSALIGPTGSNVGIGFAVPGNRARRAFERIIHH